jgi:hypothetical protein
MEDPVRTLVRHLIVGSDHTPIEASLTESERVLTILSRLEPRLESIVEIGSEDASTIAAIHTTLDSAPNYALFHRGGALRDVAERNVRTFTTTKGLHARISERSYPYLLRGGSGKPIHKTLHERVRRYTGRTTLVHALADRTSIPEPSDEPSGLIMRISEPYHRVLTLVDAARHRGYACVAFVLDEDTPSPSADIAQTTDEVRIIGYSLKPSTPIERNVYEQLIGTIMGAKSIDP